MISYINVYITTYRNSLPLIAMADLEAAFKQKHRLLPRCDRNTMHLREEGCGLVEPHIDAPMPLETESIQDGDGLEN